MTLGVRSMLEHRISVYGIDCHGCEAAAISPSPLTPRWSRH